MDITENYKNNANLQLNMYTRFMCLLRVWQFDMSFNEIVFDSYRLIYLWNANTLVSRQY